MTNPSDDRTVTVFGIGAFSGLVLSVVAISVTYGQVLSSRHLDWPLWVRAGVLIVLLLIMAVVAVFVFGATAVGAFRLWRDRHSASSRRQHWTLLAIIAGMVLISVLGVLPDPLGTPGEILYRAVLGAGIGLLLGFSQLAFAGEETAS